MTNEDIEFLLNIAKILTDTNNNTLKSTSVYIKNIDSEADIQNVKQVLNGVIRIQDLINQIHDRVDYELELRR